MKKHTILYSMLFFHFKTKVLEMYGIRNIITWMWQTFYFVTVPNIPLTNRESGIMTRALPTPTEKGILFFHESETYELICNFATCWWVTHPHQRTVVRRNWPVAMYISDVFTNKICINCGNNIYIGPFLIFHFCTETNYVQFFIDSCLGL